MAAVRRSCNSYVQERCFFYANGWCVCCGWTMELMDGAVEVIPGNHWSAPCWAVTSAHLSWKVETNLEGRKGKDMWICGLCTFVCVKQPMCEQMCVGASICVGRLQDWSEVVGLWGDCETSWEWGGGSLCWWKLRKIGGGGVSSVLIWICMSVAWIWVRTLGPVFSMLTVWGLNSESAYIPAWTQHVGLVVSLFSPLPFCLSLGPFFPLLPPPHLSLYFFSPFCAKSSFLSSFLCLCIFFPFLTPGFPPPPLCFFMLSFSLSVTHGLLFSPPLFYFTLSVLLTK